MQLQMTNLKRPTDRGTETNASSASAFSISEQ